MRELFDEIRKVWTAATPEEVVRQSWLGKMVQELGYPKELLVIEKQLSELPHLTGAILPKRRVDILCYAKKDEQLVPLLVLECKGEGLTDKALLQVEGYNHFIGARFTGILNLTQVMIRGRGTSWNHIPPYNNLL